MGPYLDGDASFLLVFSRVGVPRVSSGLVGDDTGLGDQGVRQLDGIGMDSGLQLICRDPRER